MDNNEHRCYRSGGCGPYENRSCNECPASRPDYAERMKVNADHMASRGIHPHLRNFDRLIRMDVRSLAAFMDSVQSDAYEHGMSETAINDYPNCFSAWLDWLTQEVTT